MSRNLKFFILALGLAFLAGCPDSCNQAGPSNNNNSGGGNPTPTPVVILNEAYPSGIGNWLVAGTNVTGTNNGTTGHTANGCLEVVSPGYNAWTGDHLRNDFTTSATVITTTFSIDYFLLAGLTNTVEVRLELDGQSMWRFKIQNNGASFLFNNNTMACSTCPGNSAWHRIVVKSNGTTTLSVTVDGVAVTSFTAVNPDLLADDTVDKLHLEMSAALNQINTVFRFDDLSITTP